MLLLIKLRISQFGPVHIKQKTIYLCILSPFQVNRIVERLKLEGTLKIIKFSPECSLFMQMKAHICKQEAFTSISFQVIKHSPILKRPLGCGQMGQGSSASNTLLPPWGA